MSEIQISNAVMPDEIMMDILSRLPVKSLLKCMCVSKHWRDLISDTQFIKSHLKNSIASSTHHRLLIPIPSLRSLDYNASPEDVNALVELDTPFVNPTTCIHILGSCNGLVLLIDSFRDMIIYNPSTRHSNALPSHPQVLNSSNRIDLVYGFGCGLNPFDLKVFRFPQFARDSKNVNFEVLDVNQSSWRSEVANHSYDFIDRTGTFLDKSLHWLARHITEDGENMVIASINVIEEEFTELSLPPQGTGLLNYNLGVLQGCLSFLYNVNDTHVDVWLMKKYGVANSWTKFIEIPLNVSYMMSLSSLNENEILLEMNLRKFVIYNAKNKTFRDVTAVHDLKWCGDAAVYVESLVSPDAIW